MNKVAERLRNNCGFQRTVKRGLSNYPYGEHLQDCDICQGAEEIESMQACNELLEKTFKHTHVNDPYTIGDACKECGLDLRDTGIHKKWRIRHERKAKTTHNTCRRLSLDDQVGQDAHSIEEPDGSINP